jgi:hypothetical protein
MVMVVLLVLSRLPRLSLSFLMLLVLGECKQQADRYGKNDSRYRLTDPAEGRDRGFVEPDWFAF